MVEHQEREQLVVIEPNISDENVAGRDYLYVAVSDYRGENRGAPGDRQNPRPEKRGDPDTSANSRNARRSGENEHVSNNSFAGEDSP
jgi:hypothetical protein